MKVTVFEEFFLWTSCPSDLECGLISGSLRRSGLLSRKRYVSGSNWGGSASVVPVLRQNSLPEERPRGVPVYIRMEEPGRFRDATLVRIRQPDRTGGVTLPVAHEKGRDLRLWCEFCRLAFPSRVRDACGPRGSSEYTQRAGVSGGVRQLR